MWVALKVIVILVAYFLVTFLMVLLEDLTGSKLGVFYKFLILGSFLLGVKYFWSFKPKNSNKTKNNNPKGDD